MNLWLLIPSVVAIVAIIITLYIRMRTLRVLVPMSTGIIEVQWMEIPKWWFFWPSGRSMTLKLPFIGKIVFLHPEDRSTVLKERVTLRHEGVHYQEVTYSWLFRYVVDQDHRFASEVRAFAESIRARHEEGQRYLYVCGVPMQFTEYYAKSLSEDYRLGDAYDKETCHVAILFALYGGVKDHDSDTDHTERSPQGA